MGADKNSGLSFPSYKEIAKSHGIQYTKIKNHNGLKNKLKKSSSNQKAFICELINPDEEQIPKAINRRDEKGKSVPTEFEDMYPFLAKR